MIVLTLRVIFLHAYFIVIIKIKLDRIAEVLCILQELSAKDIHDSLLLYSCLSSVLMNG